MYFGTIEYLYEFSIVFGFFRFGVPLIDGGTVRLPAIVGLGRALELILTGRAIRAKEALEWGLATRIVACGTGEYQLSLNYWHCFKNKSGEDCVCKSTILYYFSQL